jgi:hypothetical protein
MSESELSLSYDDLLSEVAAFLGYGPTQADWSAAELAEVDRYVQAGYRRFLYPPAMPGVEAGYAWSFLSPVATLVTAASAATQDLPPHVGRILGQLHYPDSDFRPLIVQVSEDRYQALLSRTETTGPPQVARVRHKPGQELVGQRLEVAWWPIPDGAYNLTYRFEAYTGKLNATNKYPLGGMRHAELLVQSCLAVAETRANDELGLHSREFNGALVAAIEQDRRLSAQHFGHMGHFSEIPTIHRHGDTGADYDITYKGNTH